MIILMMISAFTLMFLGPFIAGVEALGLKNITYDDILMYSLDMDTEKIQEDFEARMKRERARSEKARRKLAAMKPDESKLERLSMEDISKAVDEDHPWIRRAGWSSGSSGYDIAGLLDPSQEYDKWSQAYRMLGGFIDCDHTKSQNNGHKSGDQNQQNQDGQSLGCSRWMMWAAYVDPNYSGNGYDEYFGDNPSGVLDCHNPDSDWQLIGVYRQEFYQFVEQISKHLWAIDEYDYVVALAGLSYMTKYECFQVGASSSGEAIYASVAPQPEGKFEMALYTDAYCITPNDSLGLTYDSFGLTTSMALSSQDKNGNGNNNYDSDLYTWWTDTQEYTFTQLNDVYEPYKYCTSCVDYPTYQDGYFIGDYGTDDDDLINQCWKFYSHNSYNCDADCISLGHAQGTILSVTYNGVTFGDTLSEFYSVGTVTTENFSAIAGSDESRWTRLLANVFVSFSSIVFIATFLAFAVARRSRHRERSSGRSRRLLDSRGDNDGIFRSGRSARSKSRPRSSSGARSKSSSKRSSSTKERSGNSTYEPPSTRSKSTRSKSSRRNPDEF